MAQAYNLPAASPHHTLHPPASTHFSHPATHLPALGILWFPPFSCALLHICSARRRGTVPHAFATCICVAFLHLISTCLLPYGGVALPHLPYISCHHSSLEPSLPVCLASQLARYDVPARHQRRVRMDVYLPGASLFSLSFFARCYRHSFLYRTAVYLRFLRLYPIAHYLRCILLRFYPRPAIFVTRI